MQPENEGRISKKKHKKRLKHFDGMINDEKIKFLNFRFKTHSTRFENGEIIEIKSMFKFQQLDGENSVIRLENEKSCVEVIGDWKYSIVRPGNYCIAYSVKTKTEHNKS